MRIYRKIGGLHFVRIGRVRVSFCMVRRQTPARSGGVLVPVCASLYAAFSIAVYVWAAVAYLP